MITRRQPHPFNQKEWAADQRRRDIVKKMLAECVEEARQIKDEG